MKVLLRVTDSKVLEVDLSDGALVSDLKANINLAQITEAKLFCQGREMADTDILKEDSLIDVQFSLVGGAGSSDIPEHLRELAMKYRCNKMICRKCYARLPMNAHNCRKRKCGHCANIRPKKKIKEKEKGK